MTVLCWREILGEAYRDWDVQKEKGFGRVLVDDRGLERGH